MRRWLVGWHVVACRGGGGGRLGEIAALFLRLSMPPLEEGNAVAGSEPSGAAKVVMFDTSKSEKCTPTNGFKQWHRKLRGTFSKVVR